MIGVDTNVLLRLVLNDEPRQAAAARRWFTRATATQGVAIDPVVLCELVWVLRARYRMDKPSMVGVLEQLLATAGVICLNEDQVRAALAAWRGGNADFADYFLRERYRTAGAARMVSFDETLAAESGVSVPK